MVLSCQQRVGSSTSSGNAEGKPRHVSFQQGTDVFKVPANTLVIPPEEEAAVPCDASNAGQCCGFVCGTGRGAVQCPRM